MSKTPFIVFGIFAAICLILIPVWAFGKEGSESTGGAQIAAADEASKELFATNCGSCHTLAAAGTEGVVGPNLDDVLVPTGSNDPGQFEQHYARVLQAVTCGVPPGGGGRMPDGILIAEDAQEVAAFVAAYAGQIGKGPTLDTESAPRPEPPAPSDCETGS